MKFIQAFISLSLLICIALEGNSQEKSLLWKVSGKSLSQPSYIYGTVHVMCSADFEMKPKVLRAFNESKKLVLEVDISDPKEMQSVQQLMNSGKKLTDSLSDAEEQQLDSALKQHFKVGLSQVNHLEPAALESMIAMAAVPCKDKKMYEMEFIQHARQQNKPVDKLELMSEQVAFLKNAMSAKEAVYHMQLVPEYVKLFTELIGHYKNEDLEQLQRFAQDKRFMTPAAQHWILDVRNKNWIQKMPAMMKNESVFFAVGVIHLAGENGLLQLLKKDGYSVTPVLN
jgi:uncharacterized protein